MEEKYNFVSFSRLSYTQNKLGHTTFWMMHTPTGLSESVQKSSLLAQKTLWNRHYKHYFVIM